MSRVCILLSNLTCTNFGRELVNTDHHVTLAPHTSLLDNVPKLLHPIHGIITIQSSSLDISNQLS